MFLSVLALCFLSEITLFAIFDNEISLVSRATNTKQTCLVPIFQNTKRLGFNKPAVVIKDSLFVDSGICVLTVVCAICATSVQSRVSEQTHRKSSALVHKQALIKIYSIRQRKIIRPQTTRSNIICILHPFHVQNHNKLAYANS